MTSTLFILGAPDPEMAAIESLLFAAGQRVAYAMVAGVRVHPGNAYKALSVADVPGGTEWPEEALHYLDRLRAQGGEIVCVECALADERYGMNGAYDSIDCAAMVTSIDHHRPGDPGYGLPPGQYLAASSLGQVLLLTHAHDGFARFDGCWYSYGPEGPNSDNYLLLQSRHDEPAEEMLIAAADHCLAAAYRGECPGVDPDALMAWRARTRADFQGRPVAAVEADVAAARAALAVAPKVEIAGVAVARFDATVPELPEAAARDGIPFLATLTERGQNKTVLQAAPPQVVAAWMDSQRAAGLSPYGDPARGFAGVIL